MNLILSSYFTSKPDPQRDSFIEENNFELIKTWYESVLKLDLNGMIFYDSLSKEFLMKYTNNNVRFEQYVPTQPWSTNDERFLCYYNFLLKNEYITNICATDLFDVTFIKNPFNLFNNNYDLYVGCNKNEKIGRNQYMKRKMIDAYGKVHFSNNLICNAGVIGGGRDIIIKLFDCIVNEMFRIDKETNLNMAIFNKVLYSLFDSSKVLIGYPFTSKFKKYEPTGNFLIKHK